MSLFDSINETNRAYCLHHVKRSMFLYKSINYMVKNELYGFFTELMDSYGFCSQSLQAWSTQGWQVCITPSFMFHKPPFANAIVLGTKHFSDYCVHVLYEQY